MRERPRDEDGILLGHKRWTGRKVKQNQWKTDALASGPNPGLHSGSTQLLDRWDEQFQVVPYLVSELGRTVRQEALVSNRNWDQ